MKKLKRIGLSGLAATGAAALVLGLTSAPAMAAVQPEFKAPTVVTYGKVVPSKTARKTFAVNVEAHGPSGYDYRYTTSNHSGPSIAIASKNSKARYSYIYKPSFNKADFSSTATVSAVDRFNLELPTYVTPGKYRLRVPVSQRQSGTFIAQKYTDKYVSVYANTSTSKSDTRASAYPRLNRAFTISVSAPDYQAGAKVTAYVKLPGKKTYKKAASSKTLKASKYNSKASIRIPSKYSKSKAKFYFKVSSVSYAPGYQTSAYTIRPSR